MQSNNHRRPRQRFNRRAWMEMALEVLTREGNSKLRVDHIAAALGVTKGSFYAHFDSREDFLMSVVNYWDEEYTHRVKRMVEQHGGTARDRLLQTMKIVCSQGLARYDLAISSWAAHEPAVAPIVKRAYDYRLDYVRSLMKKAGFRGTSLQTRTEAFVGFMTFRGSFSTKATGAPSKQTLQAWLDFFTRP